MFIVLNRFCQNHICVHTETKPDSRSSSRLSLHEDPNSASKGAFAKKGKGGKVGLDISLLDCTLGPSESNKDVMQFDEDEPAGTYDLNLARIFDRTVLRTLVRITLQKKGGFKPNTLRLDGKSYVINPSLDFECPTKGRLTFTFNAYSSSQLLANTRIYKALVDLFESNVFNVRRTVLMDMICKGNAALTFQQVKNLVNLTYGISVRETLSSRGALGSRSGVSSRAKSRGESRGSSDGRNESRQSGSRSNSRQVCVSA